MALHEIPTFDFKQRIIDDNSEPRQKIDEASSTQKHALGSVYRTIRHNNEQYFVYAQAGAVALAAGHMQQAPAPVSDHLNQALGAGGTGAANQSEIQKGTALSTTLSADQYKDGVLLVNDSDGESQLFAIDTHEASTTPKITVREVIRTALSTTSDITLIANAYNSVIVAPTTLTAQCVGVPRIAIPASNYGWLQIAGLCPLIVDTGETLVIGENVGYPAAIAVAGACGIPAITDHIWGTVVYAAAASEYALVDLRLR